MAERYMPSRGCQCQRCSRGPLLGAAVLITLGALFLLNEFTRFSFHEGWPILLIVIGVIMVWQHAGSTEGHVPRGTTVPPQEPPPGPPTSGSDSSQVPHV